MEEDAIARRHRIGAVVLLVIDLILVTNTFCILTFVVPVFGEMYHDFDVELPPSKQVLLGVSDMMRAFHGVGFALSLGSCVALIIWTFVVLYKRGGWSGLSAFVCIVFLCSMVLQGIIVVALFVPSLRI